MPRYDYRCPEGTTFEASFPMGHAPDALECATCGKPARRRISAPHLSTAGSSAYRLIESTRRSAHEPDVVTSLPGSARRPVRYTANPLHQKLPRD
jgi:putative FmdB family regulatory protein